MREASVVADTADEPRSLLRTVELQRYSLLDARSHRCPQGRLLPVHGTQVEGLPSPVAAGEQGMVCIVWVYLYVKQPVDACMYDVGSFSLVKGSAACKHRFPRPSPIGRAEHLLAAVGPRHGAAEAGHQQMFRIVPVYAHSHIAEGSLSRWLVGCQLLPSVAVDVVAPYTAVGHPVGSRIGTVGHVHASVCGHHTVCGSVLLRSTFHGLPARSAVTAHKQIRSVH